MVKVNYGDFVKVTDGSWMVGESGNQIIKNRMWSDWDSFKEGPFKVIDVLNFPCYEGFHDIVLEHTKSGHQFLHSSRMVEVIPEKKKRTAREKLLRLIELKNEYVKSKGAPVNYVTDADFEEIKGIWSDDDCEHVWAQVHASPYCPWCITNSNRCFKCTYGKRHGLCKTDSKSVWGILCRWAGCNDVFPDAVMCEILRKIEEEG